MAKKPKTKQKKKVERFVAFKVFNGGIQYCVKYGIKILVVNAENAIRNKASENQWAFDIVKHFFVTLWGGKF